MSSKTDFRRNHFAILAQLGLILALITAMGVLPAATPAAWAGS